MKIIDKYVGRNVLLTAFFGVVILSLVLVLGNIFKDILDLLINRDVPVYYVLAFMFYVLPFSLTFTIPWGFLTALLLIFGRMSADNELIALRANGVSVPRICVPVFAAAAGLSLICFYINAKVAPEAEQKMTALIFNMATSNPMSLFVADDVVTDFPDRRVYVGGKEGGKLQNIMVFEIDERSNLTKIVHAHEGILTPDPGQARLLLRLFDARFEQRDQDDPNNLQKIRQGIVMQEGIFPVSLQALYDENLASRRISSYTLQELFARMPEVDAEEQLVTRVEINKRFSASMACIAFALIAIPLGITAHRKETSIGFAFSLAIAFTYFFFIILADTFRSNPNAYPTFLIWTPNVVFIALGSYLFWRLSRR